MIRCKHPCTNTFNGIKNCNSIDSSGTHHCGVRLRRQRWHSGRFKSVRRKWGVWNLGHNLPNGTESEWRQLNTSRPPECVSSQIDQIASYYHPRSIKTGMLYSTAIIEVVSACLNRLKASSKIVVDPVMIATSGKALIDKDAIEAIQTQLLPLADLITPNLDETDSLLGNPVRTLAEIEAAARTLAGAFEAAVLIKGGNLKRGRSR